MQGDSYGIEIDILDNSGRAVTPDDIAEVEITVGHMRRTYTSGGVFFVDNGDGSPKWVLPLSQKETFRLPVTRVNVQIRIAWSNGEVEGAEAGRIVVSESSSKEVL